jgi:hypothetical protein
VRAVARQTGRSAVEEGASLHGIAHTLLGGLSTRIQRPCVYFRACRSTCFRCSICRNCERRKPQSMASSAALDAPWSFMPRGSGAPGERETKKTGIQESERDADGQRGARLRGREPERMWVESKPRQWTPLVLDDFHPTSLLRGTLHQRSLRLSSSRPQLETTTVSRPSSPTSFRTL